MPWRAIFDDRIVVHKDRASVKPSHLRLVNCFLRSGRASPKPDPYNQQYDHRTHIPHLLWTTGRYFLMSVFSFFSLQSTWAGTCTCHLVLVWRDTVSELNSETVQVVCVPRFGLSEGP